MIDKILGKGSDKIRDYVLNIPYIKKLEFSKDNKDINIYYNESDLSLLNC